MKSVVIVIEDALADNLQTLLPQEGAWIMPPRYDAFRSSIACEYRRCREEASTFTPLQEALASLDVALAGVRA